MDQVASTGYDNRGHGPHEKRELRRIYLRPSTECFPSPNRSGLGDTGNHPRILRDGLELSLRQFADQGWTGAVCAWRNFPLGQAAINIAVNEGVTVITSTRSESKVALLTELGAPRVLLENGKLSEAVRAFAPEGIDAVLDLIGNSTLLDSLRMARKGGHVCVAGFLAGSEPVAFNWLADMPFGVDFNAFASLLFGTKDFPHSDIPMQQIVDRVADGTYKTKPVKVFPFEQIPDAHRLMESSSANGKIVVVR